MGRAYAASLGCLALASCIVHGWFSEELPESILVRGIAMLIFFACVGWVAGKVAEHIVRESMELNYRASVERMRQRNSNAVSTNQEG